MSAGLLVFGAAGQVGQELMAMAVARAIPARGVTRAQADITDRTAVAELVDTQASFTGRRPPVDAIATADYLTPARRPANSTLNADRFVATFGTRAKPWHERVDEVIRDLLARD